MAIDGSHPRPPSGQSEIDKLDLLAVKLSRRWYRMHPTKYGALHFGCFGYRFDSATKSFGTLYIAQEAAGAFAETFCRKLGVNRIGRRRLEAMTISVLEADDLNLIDIAGAGAVRAGVDGRLLCTEVDYDALTRPWADAFHRHRINADGLLYKARHDLDQPAAAIFERAKKKIRIVDAYDLDTRRGKIFVEPIFVRYLVAVIPSVVRKTKAKKKH